jgi:hypothetical protein
MSDEQRVTATIARIREIREERECGLAEARKVALQEALTDRIATAQTVEDVRPILLRIVEML